ncbi:hypothetical protein Hanom_Chr10g00909381 [Helianthus anomalus]
MISAPNACTAMASAVSTFVGEGSTMSASITMTVSAPTITSYLALEFEAELPPGYEGGTFFP